MVRVSGWRSAARASTVVLSLWGTGCELFDPCPSPGPALEAISGDNGRFAVFFVSGSAELSALALTQLSEVAAPARGTNVSKIMIVGYADRAGSAETNAALSQRRAEAVERALLAFGVDKGHIVLRSLGNKEWIIQTPPGIREAQNRVVTINVHSPSTAPQPHVWQLCPGGFRHVPIR